MITNIISTEDKSFHQTKEKYSQNSKWAEYCADYKTNEHVPNTRVLQSVPYSVHSELCNQIDIRISYNLNKQEKNDYYK